MARSRTRIRLRSTSLLSPDVKFLEFGADPSFSFVAGQWVNLFVPVPDSVVHRRSYSIASAPDPTHPGRLEFAVTRVEGGPVSTALFQLRAGGEAGEGVLADAVTDSIELEMEGPFGFFTREAAPSDRAAVFVGTGTGVTPLRSMLQQELRDRPEGPALLLLFGCRTPADLLFREEFEAMAKKYDRFRYEMTLSRAGDDWDGRRGYVQSHLEELVRPLLPVDVYVCGLTKMVKEVRRVLKEELGLTRKEIHTERYD
ncbi:MAG: FAD-dependent oxidoreductase [Myxococcota bacterium]